jgi:Holliday junction resolvase RusA-like endonuclease
VNSITFFAQGIPKGQPRPRAFARKFGAKWQARVYDAGTAECWKAQIAVAFRNQVERVGFAQLKGAVGMEIIFNFPRPKSHFRKNGELKPDAPNYHTSKPDIENCEKAVLDALTQLGAWIDDSQVCDLHSGKRYAIGNNAGASITIQQLEAQNA